jgi:hypothetical protein
MGRRKRKIMNRTESLAYVKNYFHEIFEHKNIDAIDSFVDREYFDDDIGDPKVDHIENSKKFLSDLFTTKPNIGVRVDSAIEKDGVTTSFIEWYEKKDDENEVIRKGIVIFVLRNGKILRRHTFLYFEKSI